MIVAIVRFKLPAHVNSTAAGELFEQSVPTYKAVPGLVRKYYLLGDHHTAGGCYLWQSRQDAERLYTAEWCRTMQERFGSEPSIEYFDAPVIVDNVRE